MRIHAFGVFGAQPGSGNPALVIDDDGLDAAGRQRFARERGTTCVFLGAAGGDIAASLDYVYPHARSPLCLHATLAAAAVLCARGGVPRCAVTTAWHCQRLDLVRDGAVYYAGMRPQPAPAVADESIAALLAALGLTAAAPPRVASVGSPKLLVEVADSDCLTGLAPDLALIADWGRAHGVNGLYAYCRLGRNEFEGRNFNHLAPQLEDSATGVAAGALTALLGHDLALRQGRARGHDCLIKTRIRNGTVYVGGTVESIAPGPIAV
jgi:PhzF family phenazine biosynthesis protein